eukprot:11751514-Alexandrium_andersonii.AAC.1
MQAPRNQTLSPDATAGCMHCSLTTPAHVRTQARHGWPAARLLQNAPRRNHDRHTQNPPATGLRP